MSSVTDTGNAAAPHELLGFEPSAGDGTTFLQPNPAFEPD
jgi:hypothetical protein